MITNKVLMRIEYQVLQKGKWILSTNFPTEEKYIDNNALEMITSPKTVAFFRDLGGEEKLQRQNGKIVKLVSTSPDRTERAVFHFFYQ